MCVRYFFKNIVTSSGPFRSKSLLGAVAGQGPQQDQHAGHLQRAAVLPATRRRVHGIRQAAQARVPGGVVGREAPGALQSTLRTFIRELLNKSRGCREIKSIIQRL